MNRLRSRCLISLIALAFSSQLGSLLQHPVSAADQSPPIFVSSVERTVIDVGDIFLGQNSHFKFKLRNTGPTALTINTHPNCGCTVAKYDEIIPAGGDGKIETELNASGQHLSPLTKAIHVTTDSSGKNSLQLILKTNLISIVQRLTSTADRSFCATTPQLSASGNSRPVALRRSRLLVRTAIEVKVVSVMQATTLGKRSATSPQHVTLSLRL